MSQLSSTRRCRALAFVSLADAARDGYRELAGLDLFDELISTPPTHFDGSVFVRSVGALARIDLIAQEALRVTETTDARRPTWAWEATSSECAWRGR